jgi:hypothetical protein
MFSLGNFSIGAILGLVLGAYLGHVLAIRRGKFQKKHEAAVAFKQALIPTLNELACDGSQFQIILDSFDKHREAALLFSAYLDGNARAAFLNDVQRYSNWRHEMYGRDTVEILYETNSPAYLEAKSINPVELLNSLLGHART